MPAAPDALLRLQQRIDATLATPALDHATWGIVVRSLATGEALYSLNPRRLLMPASNMKIVTLAAAAERLGWTFSFETRLVAAGVVEAGVLHGDLIVVGGGDPSLDDWDGDAARVFAAWASTIRASGITAIDGRVIGDDSLIDDNWLGSGWQWDDLDRSYAAGIAALQFNENTVKVTIAPGAAEGAPARATLGQPHSGLRLRNLVTTNAPAVAAAIETRRLAGSPLLELRGTVPLDSAPTSFNAAVYNPTLYFVSALRAALIASGIEVRGEAVDIDDLAAPPSSDAGTLLLSHYSPALPALAMTMMRLSQNLFAEAFLHATGTSQARLVLEGWGIPPEDALIADGSGLSRYNVVTPEALVTILTRVAADQRLRQPFVATLPIAGGDGSLEDRMKGTRAEGNARAKTGSFSNARALSGYVQTADGEPIVFSIIANNYGVPSSLVEQATDAIVVQLAQFSR
ncbi:MAG: D-alanyl-D-alanine carboxypeptidase/D-alanyl-D-alanine-endopeptidase [Acidobacteria bacterium RIFCSPLOWO2_02_FULL_65_29]|nr:MAG: D-alanyl-D-alanine carboxypeptidase/D-alanyl-D-alanine-endopeptidase [Acidobacteria bacterium RIFCSPLOWO2_02_FULL_65_29]